MKVKNMTHEFIKQEIVKRTSSGLISHNEVDIDKLCALLAPLYEKVMVEVQERVQEESKIKRAWFIDQFGMVMPVKGRYNWSEENRKYIQDFMGFYGTCEEAEAMRDKIKAFVKENR